MDEQYIIAKIQGLMPDEHHIPHGVLYSQLKTAVQKDLSEALNNLLKQEEIAFHKTLNDILINIPNEQKEHQAELPPANTEGTR